MVLRCSLIRSSLGLSLLESRRDVEDAAETVRRPCLIGRVVRLSLYRRPGELATLGAGCAGCCRRLVLHTLRASLGLGGPDKLAGRVACCDRPGLPRSCRGGSARLTAVALDRLRVASGCESCWIDY